MTVTSSNNAMFIGGTSVSELADAAGTPLFVYDAEAIRTRMSELRTWLPESIRVHYAIKANPFPPLLQLMAKLADGADIASAGELQFALAAGFAASNIGFAGPAKTDAELHAAIEAGVRIHVESKGELTRLAAVARNIGKRASTALRINPDFEVKGAGMRMGGGARAFGIDAENVPQLLDEWSAVADVLDFVGFHVFAGSQVLDGDVLAQTLRATWLLVRRLAASAPSTIRVVNLGGGFGIPYFTHERRLDTVPVAEALQEIATDAAKSLPDAALHVELGRYLVGEAGFYVARVVDVKESRGHVFVMTDGGMNHHLAASGNLGQVIRRNFPIALAHRMDAFSNYSGGGAAHGAPVTVHGPLCTPLDVLADRIDLPPTKVGDLLVVFQSGAYAASASPQLFLSRGAASERLV